MNDKLKSDRLTLPVFPLPEVILFPRTLLPLHVFESRYRTLVEDLLKKPKEERLIIISNLNNHNLPRGQNPFSEIGTVGKLVHTEKLKDGRSNIVLYGQFTVKIKEITSTDNPYRMAEIIKIREEYWENPLGDKTAQQEKLLGSIQEFMERTNVKIKNLEDVSIDDLINGLAYSLTIDANLKQELLEEQSLDQRMEGLIEILNQIGYYQEFEPDLDEYQDIN